MTRPVDLDQLYADINDLTLRHRNGQHRTSGLIAELLNTSARVLTKHGQQEGGRAGKPGSRPPSAESNQAIDLLADIEAGVWQHDADLRDHLDAHLSYERTWLVALSALPGLVGRLNDLTHPLAWAVERDVRHWRRAARLHLGHDSPMSTLNAPCPYCGQQSLIVRQDASSDVLCRTPGCVDERGDQPRWDRHNWSLLLTGETA